MELLLLQEQERLIAGYGEANRSAAMQVKALEARLKSKDAAMIEERAALERELVKAVQAQKTRSADTADKLRYASVSTWPEWTFSRFIPTTVPDVTVTKQLIQTRLPHYSGLASHDHPMLSPWSPDFGLWVEDRRCT